MEDMHGMFAVYTENIKTHGSLSTSFILCAISMCICFFVNLPLFVIDLRTPICHQPTSRNHVAQGPVQYSTQGQVIIPPVGQGQMFVSPGGQQNVGFVQAYTYGQCVMPPDYTSSGQNVRSDLGQTDVIPHKE